MNFAARSNAHILWGIMGSVERIFAIVSILWIWSFMMLSLHSCTDRTVVADRLAQTDSGQGSTLCNNPTYRCDLHRSRTSGCRFPISDAYIPWTTSSAFTLSITSHRTGSTFLQRQSRHFVYSRRSRASEAVLRRVFQTHWSSCCAPCAENS